MSSFTTVHLSDELAEIVGTHTTTRPEVVIMVWSYINKNKLQKKPRSWRKQDYILCDAKMKKVFGVKKFW